MFRYATYAKLGSHNLFVVNKNGEESPIISGSYAELVYHFEECSAVGFNFQFPAKYHPIAHSFIAWSVYCPVKILLELAKQRSLSRTIFPPNMLTRPLLNSYWQYCSRNPQPLLRSKFTPHSLPIGDHTFYSIKNMDSDFVHFLGRRAISRACQLYYRANAYDNVIRLSMFFRSIRHQHILQNWYFFGVLWSYGNHDVLEFLVLAFVWLSGSKQFFEKLKFFRLTWE